MPKGVYLFFMQARTDYIQLVDTLSLSPHPEGGYYREVYRHRVEINSCCLPKNMEGKRNYLTSIYFLLPHGEFSAFHKIKQDEVWYFHEGSPLMIHMIDPNGLYSKIKLGVVDDNYGVYQFTVPANVWFAAECIEENSFSLVSCAVAPGFDFNDFLLADRAQLIQEYPEHADLITRLSS